MRRLVLSCLVFACSVVAQSAHAAPVTLVFVGQVTDVPAELAGAFNVGDSAQWEVTYDTDQAPLFEAGPSSIYGQAAFSAWQGAIGSHAMALNNSAALPQQWITHQRGGPGGVDHVGYSVNYYGTNNYFMNGDTVGTLRPWAFFSDFDRAPGGGLPADGSGLSSGSFSMYYRDGGADQTRQLSGRIDSVYRVAEPSTLALIATSAFAFLARRRALARRTR